MATYQPPKRGVEYIFYTSLVSQVDAKLLKANPTMAAGDVVISKDGGAFANLTTLPTVTPTAGKGLKVTVSATEMTADNVLIIFSDAAGAEWCDLSVNVATSAQQIDDLATQASVTVIDDFLDTEVAAILAAVDTEVAAIKTKTDFLPSATAGSTGGVFIAGTNAATTVTTALTTTFTGNVTGSVGSVTGAVGSVTGAVGSVTGLTAATVHSDLDDIQTRIPAALTGAGNMKSDALAINGNTTSAAVLAILNGATVVYQGTVTGAASTTTLIDTGLTAADTDFYKGRILIFTSGALTLQATDCTAFTPATDTITFTALTQAPSASMTYVLI